MPLGVSPDELTGPVATGADELVGVALSAGEVESTGAAESAVGVVTGVPLAPVSPPPAEGVSAALDGTVESAAAGVAELSP